MSIRSRFPVEFQTGSILPRAVPVRLAQVKSTALVGTETCPAGYITNACGRDPYFFGQNHTPPWSASSQVVACCRTFVIVFTDGEPTQDQNIPTALQDYGHAHHGIHCTVLNVATGEAISRRPHAPLMFTCNTNAATPFSDLLAEHKTNYAEQREPLLG
jgi:type IV pilus assembly protein PilY1